MPDANPFAQFVETEAPKSSGNPFSQFVDAPDSGQSSYFSGMVSDIPGEIAKTAGNSLTAMQEGFDPRNKVAQGAVGGVLATGRALAAVPGLMFSPVTGTVRSVGGHFLAGAEHAIGSMVAPEIAAKDDPRQMYESGANNAELAMSAMAPGRGGLGAVRTAPPSPPGGPLGVTLSRGQETGDLAGIRKEQAAVRGQLGEASEQRAKQFFQQQGQQVEQAKNTVSQSLDPFGQTIASSPQEAGDLVQRSLQSAAANAKTGVSQAYTTAKTLPGDIDANAFNNIGQSIKGELSNRPDPVVIDDQLTPYASRSIKDVEDRIANLQIQNRASPTGQPPQQNISGITLQGVDQMRRRLSAFRKGAFDSGNAADGRATSAVIDAFDNHIDQAINSGAFQGDPRAIQAWNDARAAHADYRSTFTTQKNDPIGRVIEKIVGRSNSPAAIPNDVADFLYGSSGVNPNSLNVNVANRVKGILGQSSPEWSAVKQGLFSRLVEPGPGQTDFGGGKIAQRLNRFLNADGKEMAEAVFSPQERGLIRQYGDLQRSLEVPKTGANWSETSTFVAPMLRKIASGVAYTVGAAIGSAVAPGLHGLGEIVGAAITGKGAGVVSDMKNARQIARQMPSATEAVQKWQKALAAYNKANSPPSRVALSVATTNLARSLKPFGIELGGVMAEQGPVDTKADQGQQP